MCPFKNQYLPADIKARILNVYKVDVECILSKISVMFLRGEKHRFGLSDKFKYMFYLQVCDKENSDKRI